MCVCVISLFAEDVRQNVLKITFEMNLQGELGSPMRAQAERWESAGHNWGAADCLLVVCFLVPSII